MNHSDAAFYHAAQAHYPVRALPYTVQSQASVLSEKPRPKASEANRRANEIYSISALQFSSCGTIIMLYACLKSVFMHADRKTGETL